MKNQKRLSEGPSLSHNEVGVASSQQKNREKKKKDKNRG